MPLKNRDAYLAYQRNYYAKNREKAAETARAWAAANPDRVLANKRRYNLKNADKIRQRNAELRLITPRNMERERLLARQRYAANKGKYAAKNRVSYLKSSEKRKAYARKWRQENRAHCLMLKTRRQALESKAQGSFTDTQLNARVKFWGGRCAYCRQEADTIDHVIPLSRGGTNWPSNLRPACRRCNSSKNNKSLAEWREWKKVVRESEEAVKNER